MKIQKERRSPSSIKQRAMAVPSTYQDDTGMSFLHTVMAQASLPYRDPGLETLDWERENGRIRLSVSSAKAVDPDTGKWRHLGLPYGAKARLSLAHINRIALQTGSSTVETGKSLTDFVRNVLNLDANGRDTRTVKDQVARLAACRMRFAMMEQGRTVHVESGIVNAFDLWSEDKGENHVVWPHELNLSPDYFRSLQLHAVPLDNDHLRALSDTAFGLDIYAWLAQRLHRVKPGVPELITWPALSAQFGLTYERERDFRAAFLETLKRVLAAYRDAVTHFDSDGLWIHHSPPPVPPKTVTVLFSVFAKKKLPPVDGGAM